MREDTITTKVYTFEELNDDAKEAARNWWRECALDYEWWENIYEDAANVGIRIDSFDLDRHEISGEFTYGAQSAIDMIKEGHGQSCETHKTAMRYDGKPFCSEDEDGYEEIDEELIAELLHDLLEDYRIMLSHEVDYIMSDDNVDESIICNEYDFTEDGSIY